LTILVVGLQGVGMSLKRSALLASLLGGLAVLNSWSSARAQVAPSAAAVQAEAPRGLIATGRVRYETPVHDVPGGIYTTGEQVTLPVKQVWRPMCGSDTRGMTPDDLKAIAEAHEKRFADPKNIRVVDTPHYGPRTNVNIVYNLDATVPAAAVASFATAEAYIESQWSDPITVTVNVTFAALGPGIIGSTGSSETTQSYTTIRNGLINNRDADDTIQTFLPASPLPVRYDASLATVTNVTNIHITTANYRCTVGPVVSTDANMTYSNTFAFDFDPSNGVTGGTLSLVDVIIHETGHAMGFVSGADQSNVTYALDLFRFARIDRAGIGNTNPDTTADFSTVAREIDFDNPTGEDVNSDIISAEYRMSDGNPYQASHFFQQSTNPALAIGIMQPALANGQTFYPSFYKQADRDMFDAIGWDFVGGCVAPSITTQPTALTRCTGVSATFSVVASGTATLTYQWRKNTVNIGGATNASYTIASPVVGDAANYDCVVTNGCGNATTNSVALTVNTAPAITLQPVSLTRCVGVSATFTVAASGSPAPTFQWRKGGVNIGGATSSSFTIASPVVGDAANYDCVVTNSCGSATSNAVALTVNTAPGITLQPVALTRCVGVSATFTVAASGTPAPTFQWRKGGVNIGGATSASYTIASPVVGDAANYDCVVTNSCGSATSNAVALTVNTAPSITTQPSAQTACAGLGASFTVAASGTPSPTFQWRKNLVNIGGATAATYSIASTVTGDAGSYDCVITNSCGSATSNAVSLTVNTAPGITTQPSPQSVCAGFGASFTVAASGTPAPTFQWRKNTINIGGATAATYSIASTVVGDAGSYDCVVTNSCGSATSNAVALAVNTGPSISTQPVSQSVSVTDPVTFTVVASGTPAPTYQWRLGGVDIGGATASTYSIASASISDAGNYDVVVTNSCGSTTSDIAVLTVDHCIADLADASGNYNPDGGVGIEDLLLYLIFFNAGDLRADLVDGGGNPPGDGGVGIEDLLFYLGHFNAGC